MHTRHHWTGVEQTVEVFLSLSLFNCEPDGQNDTYRYAEYFQRLLFMEAFFLQTPFQTTVLKAVTSKEMALKKLKETDGHFSPRMLCSGLSKWGKKIRLL